MTPFNKNNEKVNKQVAIDDNTLNIMMVLVATITALLIMVAVYFIVVGVTSSPDSPIGGGDKPVSGDASYPFKQEISLKLPTYKDDSATISGTSSEYSVLLNLSDNEIVASKRSSTTIYPASMTKIMTLIVVFENLPNKEALDTVLTINIPRGEHSGYGFEIGEKLTVRDLIYAAVLQSDGVACITLAEYIAGSEAAFVKLMNDKVRELGLLDGDPENLPSTNFTNCSGLHEQYHFTTAYDMAVITAYAMQNTYCADVLTAISYKPSENFRPGEGCTFWHSLLHNRLNDGALQPSTATIKGGKTGWTGDESGYCIASFAEGKDGNRYILVTAKAESWVTAVDDSINIYKNYAK